MRASIGMRPHSEQRSSQATFHRMVNPRHFALERAETKLPTEDCIIWDGSKDGKGYGKVMFNYKSYRAHRVMYERHIGTIPEGMVIDHLCRNKSCVNPKHLEPVTQRENIHRGVGVVGSPSNNAQKTHCKRGHEFTPENTLVYMRNEHETQRRCRTCMRAYQRKRYAERKKSNAK